jgi:hypothetical protein
MPGAEGKAFLANEKALSEQKRSTWPQDVKTVDLKCHNQGQSGKKSGEGRCCITL